MARVESSASVDLSSYVVKLPAAWSSSDQLVLRYTEHFVLVNAKAVATSQPSRAPKGTIPDLSNMTLCISRLPSIASLVPEQQGRAGASGDVEQLPQNASIARVLTDKVIDLPQWTHDLFDKAEVSRLSTGSRGAAAGGAKAVSANGPQPARLIVTERVQCTLLEHIQETQHSKTGLSEYDAMIIARDIAKIVKLLLHHGIDLSLLTMDNLAWSTAGCDEGNGGRVVLLPIVLMDPKSSGADIAELNDSACGSSSPSPVALGAVATTSTLARDPALRASEEPKPSSHILTSGLNALVHACRDTRPTAAAASGTGELEESPGHESILGQLARATQDDCTADRTLVALEWYLMHAPVRFSTSGDPDIDQDARHLLPLLSGPCPESSAIDAAREAFEELHAKGSCTALARMLWCIHQGLGIIHMDEAGAAVRELLREQAVQLATHLVRGNGEAALFEAVTAAMNGTDTVLPQYLAAFVVQACSSSSKAAKKLLIDAGALQQLLDMVQSDQAIQRSAAALAVGALGSGQSSLVLKSGAVPLLVSRLSSVDDFEATCAAHALLQCATGSPEIQGSIIDAKGIPAVLDLLQNAGDRSVDAGAGLLAELAWHSGHARSQIVSLDGVDTLVHVLGSTVPPCALAAIRALHGIIQGNPDACQSAADAGAIGSLVRIVHGESAAHRTVAVQTLACIAEVLQDAKGTNIDSSELSGLVAMLKLGSGDTLLAAAYCLRYYSSGPEELKYAVAESGAPQQLARMVSACNIDDASAQSLAVQIHVVGGLMHLASNAVAHQAVVESESIPALLRMLGAQDKILVQLAATTLTAFASRSPGVRALSLDAGLLSVVKRLVQSCHDDLAAVDALAECIVVLVGSSRELHQRLVAEGIIDILVCLLGLASSMARCQAVGGLCMLYQGPVDVVGTFVGAGGIQALVSMINSPSVIESKHACTCLAKLCHTHTHVKKELMAAGALDYLSEALGQDSNGSASGAAAVLWTLCRDSTDILKTVVNDEVVSKLSALLGKGSLDEKAASLGCLGAMVEANDPDVIKCILRTEIVPVIVSALAPEAGLMDRRSSTLKLLCAVVEGNDGAMRRFAELGGMVHIVDIVNQYSEGEQEAALEYLSCMARAANSLKVAVVQASLVPRLVEYLDPDEGDLDPVVVSKAYNVLLNLGSGCLGVRDAMSKAGVLPVMIKWFQSDSLETQQLAAEFIQCYARNHHGIGHMIVDAGVLPHLVRIAQEAESADGMHNDLLCTVWYALNNIASGCDGLKTAVVQSGVVPSMVQLVQSGSHTYAAVAALQCLCTTLDGGNDVLYEVIEADYRLIACLVDTLSHASPELAGRSLSALTCIAAISPDMATNVINHGAVPVLIDLMLSEEKRMLLHMVAGALACIAFHSGPPNNAVQEANVLPALIKALQRRSWTCTLAIQQLVYYLVRDRPAISLALFDAGLLDCLSDLYFVVCKLASLEHGADPNLQKQSQAHSKEVRMLLVGHAIGHILRYACSGGSAVVTAATAAVAGSTMLPKFAFLFRTANERIDVWIGKHIRDILQIPCVDAKAAADAIGITSLVDMLGTSRAESAVHVLHGLSISGLICTEVAQSRGVAGLCVQLQNPECQYFNAVASALHNVLDRTAAKPAGEVVGSGVLPHLIHRLRTCDTNSVAAAWIVCDIAKGSVGDVTAVVQAGSLEAVQLVMAADFDLPKPIEQCFRRFLKVVHDSDDGLNDPKSVASDWSAAEQIELANAATGPGAGASGGDGAGCGGSEEVKQSEDTSGAAGGDGANDEEYSGGGSREGEGDGNGGQDVSV